MNYNVKSYRIYLFILCAFTIFSCKQNSRPDVSGIKIDIKIQRFEQDLYQFRTKNPPQADALLTKKYGIFYRDFITQMVGTPNLTGVEVLENLYKGQAYADLQHEVDSVYPNLKKTEEELTQTFKYIRFYYPKVKIPNFVSFLSGFAYQIPIGENYMGIGLDMFLGKDSKFYPALIKSIPKYQSRRFEPNNIVPRIAEEFAKEGGDMEIIQLWVNLPREHKMTSPKYQDIKSETIPVINQNGFELKLVAGEYNKSP